MVTVCLIFSKKSREIILDKSFSGEYFCISKTTGLLKILILQTGPELRTD
jgi:hypothetical protein